MCACYVCPVCVCVCVCVICLYRYHNEIELQPKCTRYIYTLKYTSTYSICIFTVFVQFCTVKKTLGLTSWLVQFINIDSIHTLFKIHGCSYCHLQEYTSLCVKVVVRKDNPSIMHTRYIYFGKCILFRMITNALLQSRYRHMYKHKYVKSFTKTWTFNFVGY